MKKNKSHSPLPPPPGKIKEVLIGFADAIQAIIDGKTVRRKEWNEPEEYCLLKDSYLMIHRNNKFHGWTVSEGDMMAVDWYVVK